MKQKILGMSVLLSALAFTSNVLANDATVAIKGSLKQLNPNANIKSIIETPAKGIYEVIDDSNGIVYVTEDGKFLMSGSLVDIVNKKNLTRERAEELSKIDFNALPLGKAFKYVNGTGQYKIAVFSDPMCPYCKRAEADFEKLENTTVYVFPFPLNIHPGADTLSKQIWCSPNKEQAWRDYLLKNVSPTSKDDCPNPVEDSLKLGASLGVNGTPTIYFENGKKYQGATTPATMIEAIKKNSK